jgi:SnoaL-like domain
MSGPCTDHPWRLSLSKNLEEETTLSQATAATPGDTQDPDGDGIEGAARANWDLYAQSWKVPTASEKRSLYEASLSDGCTYTDPLVDLEGWDAIEAYMIDFHRQIPGGHFVTRWFQAHHHHGIAAWDMVAEDGTKVGEGISHVRFAEDGKLAAMTGFFDVPTT